MRPLWLEHRQHGGNRHFRKPQSIERVLPRFEPGHHRRSVVISSTTGQKFRITSVKVQRQDVRIESSVDMTDEAPRQRVTFEALDYDDSKSASADGKRRFLSGTLQVHTTDKLRPVVEIPWSAMLDSSFKLDSEADSAKSSSERRL